MSWIAAHNLRDTLLAITSGEYAHEQLHKLVRLCQALSIACIQNRANTPILKTVHGLTTPDIAIDCIAELFQQSEHGDFVQLKAFFDSIPLQDCSDEQSLVHLRRLVFSKTYNGLFRLYSEADPSLGKVLRNVKLAVHSLGHCEERLVLGEPSLAPSGCDLLEHLPLPDAVDLERDLAPLITGAESVPVMLAVFARHLREQNTYRRVASLMDVAIVFRSFYSRGRVLPEAVDHHMPDISRHDREVLLATVGRSVRESAERSYVQAGKLSPEQLNAYLRVIDAGLQATWIDLDGVDFSLFEALRAEMPDLSLTEYKQIHRSRLEYLSRRAHDLARDLLRKE